MIKKLNQIANWLSRKEEQFEQMYPVSYMFIGSVIVILFMGIFIFLWSLMEATR